MDASWTLDFQLDAVQSRDARPAGVSRVELIFERCITQCGARVDELKRQGYVIVSKRRQGETYVRYVLKGEPFELRPLPDVDWFERTMGSKRPRDMDNLPLFSPDNQR